MAPLIASLLIGVAVKVGVGLAASFTKKALDEANAKEAQGQSFGNLLKAQRAGGAERGFSLEGRPVSRSGPSDLAGRIASVERLHVLALDAQARQSLPGPSGSRGADAYRRLAVTAP